MHSLRRHLPSGIRLRAADDAAADVHEDPPDGVVSMEEGESEDTKMRISCVRRLREHVHNASQPIESARGCTNLHIPVG